MSIWTIQVEVVPARIRSDLYDLIAGFGILVFRTRAASDSGAQLSSIPDWSAMSILSGALQVRPSDCHAQWTSLMETAITPFCLLIHHSSTPLYALEEPYRPITSV